MRFLIFFMLLSDCDILNSFRQLVLFLRTKRCLGRQIIVCRKSISVNSMFNKTVIEFHLCDIPDYKRLNNCYHTSLPQP